MSYNDAVNNLLKEDGVELSTMMKTPCIRYKGEFLGMMFDKQDCLIVKVSPKRVDEIIAEGFGMEFNFTKKRFKEWVLIPESQQKDYDRYMSEALDYAKSKAK